MIIIIIIIMISITTSVIIIIIIIINIAMSIIIIVTKVTIVLLMLAVIHIIVPPLRPGLRCRHPLNAPCTALAAIHSTLARNTGLRSVAATSAPHRRSALAALQNQGGHAHASTHVFFLGGGG